LLGGLLERHRAGGLERRVGGVDPVGLAVEERHPHVDHRVPGRHAALHLVPDALLHAGMKLFGMTPPTMRSTNSKPSPRGSGSTMSHGAISSGLSLLEIVSPVSAAPDLVIAHTSPATA